MYALHGPSDAWPTLLTLKWDAFAAITLRNRGRSSSTYVMLSREGSCTLRDSSLCRMGWIVHHAPFCTGWVG